MGAHKRVGGARLIIIHIVDYITFFSALPRGFGRKRLWVLIARDTSEHCIGVIVTINLCCNMPSSLTKGNVKCDEILSVIIYRRAVKLWRSSLTFYKFWSVFAVHEVCNNLEHSQSTRKIPAQSPTSVYRWR